MLTQHIYMTGSSSFHKNSVKRSLSEDIEANGDQFEEDLNIVDALPQFIY